MSKRLVENCNVIKVSDIAGLGWKGMVDRNDGAEDNSLATLGLQVGRKRGHHACSTRM